MMFTIEDAKQVQRDLGLGDRHVAWVDLDEGFVLAHTNDERNSGKNLHDCEIHLWLADTDPGGAYGSMHCCFVEPGWYVIWNLHVVEGLAL